MSDIVLTRLDMELSIERWNKARGRLQVMIPTHVDRGLVRVSHGR